MNELWINILCVTLVSLGGLAELNLVRIFLRDWRAGRREDKERLFPNEFHARAAGAAPARPRVTGWRLAAFIVSPAWAASAVCGQEPTTPEKPAADLQASSSAPAPPGESPATEAAKESAASALSLQINLDFTNAYFYHGIIQQDDGLITQPAAKLTVNLYKRDDFRIDAILATWNSFGENGGTAQGDLVKSWYESDLVGGFALTKGALSLTTSYLFLTSPSDAYQTVQELDFNLSYDDSELLGKFAVHPYALLAFETGADYSDGANTNAGTYLELGIAPGFSFDAGRTPIAISFPAAVGLSLHDYYENAVGESDTFGFFQIGAKAAIPLPVNARYGAWTLNLGVAGIFLGGNTAEYNGGQNDEFIATAGLQWNF